MGLKYKGICGKKSGFGSKKGQMFLLGSVVIVSVLVMVSVDSVKGAVWASNCSPFVSDNTCDATSWLFTKFLFWVERTTPPTR